MYDNGEKHGCDLAAEGRRLSMGASLGFWFGAIYIRLSSGPVAT